MCRRRRKALRCPQRARPHIDPALCVGRTVTLFEREARALLATAKDQPRAARERVRELEAKVANLVDALTDGTMKASPALAAKLSELEAALAAARREPVPASVARILPRAFERFRKLARELPKTARRDPSAGREALREVTGGRAITLRPTGDGGVEAVVPLAPLAKLLNASPTMSIGSGGPLPPKAFEVVQLGRAV